MQLTDTTASSQDPELYQYINIYNMWEYIQYKYQHPLNKLSKAFELGQQGTTQWEKYSSLKSENGFKYIVYCLLAV